MVSCLCGLVCFFCLLVSCGVGWLCVVLGLGLVCLLVCFVCCWGCCCCLVWWGIDCGCFWVVGGFWVFLVVVFDVGCFW